MLISEGFQQPPLQIPLAYSTDPVFEALLERILPAQTFRQVDEELKQFEVRLAGREFVAPISTHSLLTDRRTAIRRLASTIDTLPHSVEPTLTQYDQWGRRVDELKTSEGWRELKKIAVVEGLVAIAMERKEGEFSRIRSFAKVSFPIFRVRSLYIELIVDGAVAVGLSFRTRWTL